jgi:TPR repeat protein
MSALGYMYGHGRGVPRDDKKGRQSYEKAAEAGDATAMYNLGALYENGIGVAPDNQQARRWYQRAADAGDKNALDRLKELQQ